MADVEVELVCMGCGRSWGRYLAYRVEGGAFLREGVPPGRRPFGPPRLEWAADSFAPRVVRDYVNDSAYRRVPADAADRREGQRGPRTGRRTFRVVRGRDGLDAARFTCGCGRTRTMGPREILRALRRWESAEVPLAV